MSQLTRPMLWASEKLQNHQLERLAVVYVRQSTLQQVLHNQESTRAQYALVEQAAALGWSRERILVIDDDLGKSGADAEHRLGFQRLVAEVGLNHVGLILGVEMSRLARSNRDWHQLLEICALFATLIADHDGIYDPSDYNDRLLLGLKGTMSEAELHLLKQRAQLARLTKAKRGALSMSVPLGYVHQTTGEVVFDPDEQVQTVIRLAFSKFRELGSVNALWRYFLTQGIELGFRERGGAAKGQLTWKSATRASLFSLLKHPIYAGAYVFGRRQSDPRKRHASRSRSAQVLVAPEDWHVLIHDHYPAYISWQQYEEHQAMLRANCSWPEHRGAVREGPALLTGLLRCRYCDRQMLVQYNGAQNTYGYTCAYPRVDAQGNRCRSLAGTSLDSFVAEQILKALEPASLELSLKAAANLEQERADLDKLWQQRVERASYDAERASRHYQLLEPENRLVARSLAKDWEDKLSALQALEEDYRRFSQAEPRLLNPEEAEAIKQLAQDIPALWHSAETTPKERKILIRHLIETIHIALQGDSEKVTVDITWVGGHISTGLMIRPVARLEQLSYYPELCERVRDLAGQAYSAHRIAEQLDEEGFKPPKRFERFGKHSVYEILNRLGISRRKTKARYAKPLKDSEWYIPDLARELKVTRSTLRRWVLREWVKAYRQEGSGRWVIRADSTEVDRLKNFYQRNTHHKFPHDIP